MSLTNWEESELNFKEIKIKRSSLDPGKEVLSKYIISSKPILALGLSGCLICILGAVHILVPYSDVSSSDVSFPPSLLIFLRALIVNRHIF